MQHVHHHYHHGEGDSKKPTIIVNNPIPIGAESHIHSQGISSQQSGGYQSSSSLSGLSGLSGLSSVNSNTGGFSPVNSGFGGSGGLYGNVKPVYENQNGGFSSSGNTNLNSNGFNKGSNSGQGQSTSGVYNLGYASGSGYTPSSGLSTFGSSVGQYGNSNQFYKKELNIPSSPVNNNLLGGGSNYYGQGSNNQYGSQFGYTKGQESGRQENYDCVCVPYDQCPSQDVIGRKDDLFLPIDPRNLGSDIAAEEEVTVTDGNGTMTIVRVTKDISDLNNVTEVTKTETKKITKREVNDKASASASKDIEPVRIIDFVIIYT